jgi:hypothetical protein
MDQIIAVVAALLILIAYTGNQMGWIDRTQPAYSWMNLIGSIVLTIVALRAQQWGFVLLEGVWAAVSLPPLIWRRSPSS